MKVTYINHMGSDSTVADAARVSFNKRSDNYTEEQNAKLIRYLAEHNHWTPFAHPQIQLHVKVPIFVARQLGKHQVGMVWNEVSRRYVDSEPEYYWPAEWRGRAENKKQGSAGVINKLSHKEGREDLWGDYDNKWHPTLHMQFGIEQAAIEHYRWLLESGVAPEQARIILPQNIYTEFYWTGSLAAWARVYNLRSKEDTQEETREIARQIMLIIRPIFPVSWEALCSVKSTT